MTILCHRKLFQSQKQLSVPDNCFCDKIKNSFLGLFSVYSKEKLKKFTFLLSRVIAIIALWRSIMTCISVTNKTNIWKKENFVNKKTVFLGRESFTQFPKVFGMVLETLESQDSKGYEAIESKNNLLQDNLQTKVQLNNHFIASQNTMNLQQPKYLWALLIQFNRWKASKSDQIISLQFSVLVLYPTLENNFALIRQSVPIFTVRPSVRPSVTFSTHPCQSVCPSIHPSRFRPPKNKHALHANPLVF